MTNSLSSKVSRLVVAGAIFVSCVGCDQITKHIATSALREAPPRSYLGGTVRLEYALNSGGFLSVGSTLSPSARLWVFTLANGVLLAGIGVYLVRRWNMRLAMFLALSLILAGGVGNLIDRVINEGLVTDFLILGYWPLQTGIINLADVALTVGGVLCVVLAGRTQREPTPA